MKKKSVVISAFTPEARLKRKIRAHLRKLGFVHAPDGSLSPQSSSKESIRTLHLEQRRDRLKSHKKFIQEALPTLETYFANGSEIEPEKIQPRLELIEADTWQSDLFRLASLSWSVPVSYGFGRRLRYLVWDDHNDKLIGIIALGDPVYNLRVRDELIGWTVNDRSKRLVSVLDAYVLGSVPPYNMILGGKLVACLIRTKEVRNDFALKYGNTRGIISKKKKRAQLVLVTTSSSLGRSSVYNRLKLGSQAYLKAIGFTQGWGHFHVPDSLFAELRDYAPGRLIVINKETYRSGGVTANVLPTTHNRAAPLFAGVTNLVHCDNCSFVRDLEEGGAAETNCPVCESELQTTQMIVPQVFLPEDGKALDEDDRDQDITYATGAQFPVPVGANDLPEMTPIGQFLSYAVTTDRKLVTANKGQLQNDSYNGFWVCECCGRSALEEPPAGSHQRPYKVEFAFGQPRAPRQCNGQFQKVFLGHVFKTDLLLLRFEIKTPIVTDTTNPVVLRALEDSLYSIAEALRLAASRHPQLDLDPSEFGAGFRIVPAVDSDATCLDVYLYDTLSGGAGYADLAGRHLAEILDGVQALLEECPSHCDRSCESCLRHYHNQHLKDRLDRRVAAQLLRYARLGEIPPEETLKKQAADLTALRRLLELDGFRCTAEARVETVPVPVLVEKDGERIAIGIKSGLLDESWKDHSLEGAAARSIPIQILNDFILRRNLPDEHQLIREHFGE